MIKVSENLIIIKSHLQNKTLTEQEQDTKMNIEQLWITSV